MCQYPVPRAALTDLAGSGNDNDAPRRDSSRRSEPAAALHRRARVAALRDIYVEVNFRQPVSGDGMWPLRMQ